MDFLIALGNGINPGTPPNGCEINVLFCFVLYVILAMFVEEGCILHRNFQETMAN